MSMDDQYRQLELFNQSLIRFHDHMQSSLQDLDQRYQVLEPFWNDEMRRDHDAKWVIAVEIIKVFLNFTGHRYIAFFIDKIMLLGRYLRGAM